MPNCIMVKNKYIKLIFLGLSIFVAMANAALKLELTQGLTNKITVAIVGFELPGSQINKKIKTQVMADLALSGEIKIIDLGKITAATSELSKAKSLGAKYLVRADVAGSLIARYYNVELQFYDLSKNTNSSLVDTTTYNFKVNDLVTFTHVLDDDIYSKVTGLKGLFSTRIAYVLTKHKAGMSDIYNLEVADFDGGRSQTIASSNMPIILPAWSHSGKKIAYVSFENDMPAVYTQEILTGKRENVTVLDGVSSSLSFAPDDESLALVLSSSGAPKIYTLDLTTKILSPIKSTVYDIDIEPVFSPSGDFIYFTSNRAGHPNIYKYDLELESIDRISFTGDYNSSAAITADGKYLVYLHREGGLFSLNSLNLINNKAQTIASDGYERAPSLAPNGNVVSYGSQYASRSILGFVSLNGKIKWRLPALSGNISDPAWSPFIAKKKDFLVNYSISEA